MNKHEISEITSESNYGWLITCTCGAHSGWHQLANDAREAIDQHLGGADG